MDLSRTELLLGKEGLERLKNARIAVFGLGGVGSYCVEALARSGVGQLDLFDDDVISPSNINRQLFALHNNNGKHKVDIAKNRILSINPKCIVTNHKIFYDASVADNYRLSNYDYIVDAIDTITSKIELIVRANAVMVPIISCMGTGNKLMPQSFEVANISKTLVCPLARVMRKELKARGVNSLKVVFSKEEPKKASLSEPSSKKHVPGSVSFVPGVAGLILAGEVIKDLIVVK